MYRQLEKQLVKQQSTRPHNTVNFGPLTAEIDWRVWGTPNIFQRASHLGFATAPMLLNGGQPNFALYLAVSWAGILYIHFWGLLSPNGILPRAKFTLHSSLAFSYIGSVTARHSSSGHQANRCQEFSRGHHLYSAGRPSRWASAHILVIKYY